MFNLADYEPVEVRLEKFIKDYPDFRIATELELVEKDRYIIKAYLFKTSTDTIAWATGYAEETVSARGVNQTSALENCETSAIGRALANSGYAPKGKRPSREEMTKVVKQAPVKPAPQDIKEGDIDYWTTPLGDKPDVKTVQAPASLAAAMENIAAVLGTGEASESPQCEHGSMKWREGDKNGKAWGGFFCTTPSQTGGRPVCPTKWYVLSGSGQWEPQKPRV
jgi:hypothetical protein